MTTALRTTQRAPKSCLPCAARKVKCDKAVPCSTCIRRGEGQVCIRETVIVRGEVKTWNELNPSQSVDDLRQENERLRQELSAYRDEAASSLQTPKSAPSGFRKARHLQNDDPLEDALWRSIALATLTSRSRVAGWTDIILPSRVVSEHLIAFDKTWNSWVHYALEYPHFQHECDSFMECIERDSALERRDPYWMSVYFSVLSAALLMMDDDEADRLINSGFQESLDLNAADMSRLWYDAAIFCLNRAEFMRVPHICTVQSIAILGMCFNVYGDADLGQHMRSSAIRVAQRLGLDTPCSDRAGPLSPEGQHRLWWTLVICEWLNVPYEPPQVEEVDFDVPLPSPSLSSSVPGGGPEDIDPAHYHVFMARTARVYNRFCQSLQRGSMPSEEAVRTADEELAQVIDTLPEHLQPDFTGNDDTDESQMTHPWVKWQRFDITLVLLHHRVRINRTLQSNWLAAPGEFAWARAVSIRSSMDIIWISRNWDQPVSMRKQWALSFHLLVASILLLREWQNASDGRKREYEDAIEAAISLLDQVKSHNAVAFHAIRVLRGEMSNMQ